MAKTNISEAMQGAIGGELSRSTSFPISDSDIRRWAVAVYYPEDPPRLFWDADYAAQTAYGGIVAPEEFNPFAWMSAEGPRRASVGHNPDLTETTLGVAGPGLKFQLNGGSEVEYGVRMRPGDVITSVRSLASYSEREGRLGLMLFTVSQDVWTNQDNAVVKTTKSTLIRY
jgi:N-terminal half of MaoC dehydratase